MVEILNEELYEHLKQKAKFRVEEYDDYMRYSRGIEDYTAEPVESHLLGFILEYIDNNDTIEVLTKKFENDYPGYIESVIIGNSRRIYATEHKGECLKLEEFLKDSFYNKLYLEELEDKKYNQENIIKNIEETLKPLLEEQNGLKNKKYKIFQLFNGERKNDNIIYNELSNKIKEINVNLENEKNKYDSLNKNYEDVKKEQNKLDENIKNITDNLKYDYKEEIEEGISKKYYLNESYDLETILDFSTEYKTEFCEKNIKLEKMKEFIKQEEVEYGEEYSAEDEEDFEM